MKNEIEKTFRLELMKKKLNKKIFTCILSEVLKMSEIQVKNIRKKY